MNWEAIGAISEGLGAIGVLVTLGYVAMQIRQNTRAVEANTYHTAATAAAGFSSLIATSPELAEFYHKGVIGEAKLEGGSLERFDSLLDCLLLADELAFDAASSPSTRRSGRERPGERRDHVAGCAQRAPGGAHRD
jgi:hypothetical protein